MSRASAEDFVNGYEALRSQATGGPGLESPCGMAVMLSQGVPAWMRARVLPGALAASAPVPPAPRTAGGLSGEVVRLLTEMVLGGSRRLAIS